MLASHPSIAQLHVIDRDWKRHGLCARLAAESRLLRALRARKLRSARAPDRAPARPDARAPAAAALRGDAASESAAAAVARHFTHFYRLPRSTPRHTVERTSTRCVASASIRSRATSRWSSCRAARPRARAGASGAARPRRGAFVQVHPGSRWLFKCWPAERTAQLIDRLRRRHGRRDDRRARSRASRRSCRRSPTHCATSRSGRVVDLAGQLSLTELAALDRARTGFRRRRLGADAHRRRDGHADARLFGPSGEHEWGPWMVAQRVRRVHRAPVPPVRHRRLRRRQGLRVPDHAAGRAAHSALIALLARHAHDGA